MIPWLLFSLFDPESKTKGKEGNKTYEAQKSFAIVASPKQDEESQKEDRSKPVSRVHPIIESQNRQGEMKWMNVETSNPL